MVPRRARCLALAVFLCLPLPADEVAPAFDRVRAGAAPLAVGVHGPNRAWRAQDVSGVAGDLSVSLYPGPNPSANPVGD